MSGRSSVTVVVLCRNNPAALATTLHSVLSQQCICEVLVVDGSEDDACARVAAAMNRHGMLQTHRAAPQGIYSAMNAAIERVTTPWLQFLHSGDHFFDSWSLHALVDHAERRQIAKGVQPVAVFGQALIEAVAPDGLCWLTPDPQMRRVGLWLRHMVPCHQAVLFATDWARKHPYDTRNAICADRPVMRMALAKDGEAAYLARPICRFRLDGLSSSLPDWQELHRRWREPARSKRERFGELGKFLLKPAANSYPQLMRWRSRVMGWLCR